MGVARDRDVVIIDLAESCRAPDSEIMVVWKLASSGRLTSSSSSRWLEHQLSVVSPLNAETLVPPLRLERQEAFSTLSATLLFEPVELPLHHFDGRTERFERGHNFVVEVRLGVLSCVRDVVASILQIHRLPLR
jgi:hypothetical protein